MAFYPTGGNATRVSAGVDAAGAAPVIGRQWFSWAPTDADDEHYRWAVAPARTFYRSLEVGAPPRHVLLPLLCPALDAMHVVFLEVERFCAAGVVGTEGPRHAN